MPGWVGITERVVPGIAVTIQILRLPRIGHDRVWREEATQGRVVVARAVVVQVGAAVEFLIGVFIGDIHCRVGAALVGPRLPIGIVGQRLHQGAGAVGDHGAGAEMVLVPGKDGARYLGWEAERVKGLCIRQGNDPAQVR